MNSSILYDRILRSPVIPLNSSNTSFSVDINSPLNSLKGVLQRKEVLLKILVEDQNFKGKGGGWGGGSSERCLKWGGGRWAVIKGSFQKHLKTAGV